MSDLIGAGINGWAPSTTEIVPGGWEFAVGTGGDLVARRHVT